MTPIQMQSFREKIQRLRKMLDSPDMVGPAQRTLLLEWADSLEAELREEEAARNARNISVWNNIRAANRDR